MTDSTTPEKVTLLAIAGPRHGEKITINASDNFFIDLLTANTYYVKPMSYIRRDPATSAATGMFTVNVLVHETLTTLPNESPIAVQAKTNAVNQMWIDVVMRDWMEQNGTQQPLTDVPNQLRNPRIRTRPAGGNN